MFFPICEKKFRMNFFILIFVWDPNFRKIEDERLEICFIHVEEVLRNIVAYYIIKNCCGGKRFLYVLELRTADRKIVLDG
jgi:hypothetical protein